MKMMLATMNSGSLIMEWFSRCRKEPCTAMALCSPKIACIAIPTRIKPIWDIEEQAKVRLKLVENTANTAPVTIVSTASTNRIMPHVKLWRNTLAVIPRIPKIPALLRIADSSAVAGPGAAT